MRTAAVTGSAILALLCGVALIFLGLNDAGDGRTRAVLPIVIGAALTVGGLLFLRKGVKR
ncbi:sodium:neurotransmitter symporter [Streptomyces sp. NPDC087420]|uniref:sodium:neurotransmitter symporter n=1 Tax=Streptomyces sp. NPDC087420 TaxID=3365785 RepID=UPI003833FB73